MKRRNFIRKGIATAVIAAAPVALTGLVNAAGGGGGTGSTTTHFEETTVQTTYEQAVCTGPQQRYDAGSNKCWERWSCRFTSDGASETRYGASTTCPTIEQVFQNPNLLSQLEACMNLTPEAMAGSECETATAA